MALSAKKWLSQPKRLPTPALAPRNFVWKPYNDSARPLFFYDRPPKIVQDLYTTTTSGTVTTIVPPTSRPSALEAPMAIAQETSTANGSRVSTTISPRPVYAVLEVSKTAEPTAVKRLRRQFAFSCVKDG